ncbi:MAG: hypothetical protein ACLT2I_09495, partial [Corynebacterium variabile]
GMMTRGEVALIVAQKGLGAGVVDPVYFTAVILLIVVGLIIVRARKQPVHADNVNADWDEHGLAPAEGHSDSALAATESSDLAATAGRTLSGATAGVHDPAHFVDTSAGIDTSTNRKDV